MKQCNEEAKADEHVLRISLAAKATVRVGPFARGGKSRVRTFAADHDFQLVARVTPVGTLLPASDELFAWWGPPQLRVTVAGVPITLAMN